MAAYSDVLQVKKMVLGSFTLHLEMYKASYTVFKTDH